MSNYWKGILLSGFFVMGASVVFVAISLNDAITEVKRDNARLSQMIVSLEQELYNAIKKK